MRLNPKIIQLFGDALIPLLGFFWWNWNLYFIVLFYLLDYLSNELFMYFKTKKCLKTQNSSQGNWIFLVGLSLVLLLFGFFLIHMSMREIAPNMDFLKEIVKFWNYKDMGIEQGYILLPLIILVGYQRYKLEFILPGKFKTQTIVQLWNEHLKAQYMIFALVAITYGCSQFFIFPEAFYVVSIVLSIALYQLFFSTNAVKGRPQ